MENGRYNRPRPATSSRARLRIRPADLEAAADRKLIDPSSVSSLWQFLSEQKAPTAFNLPNLAAYIGGGFIVLAALWFLIMVGMKDQAPAVTATTVILIIAFSGAGAYLWFAQNARVAGGLFVTLAVVLIPLLVLAIMTLDDTFDAEGTLSTQRELIIEGATIAAALLAIWLVRFPMITAPLFTALWWMSLTIINSIFAQHDQSAPIHIGGFDLHIRILHATAIFGGFMTALAVIIDRRTNEDFAFWAYLFGVTSGWMALTSLANEAGEPALFGYFVLNVIFMIASVPLQRLIFLILGGIGASGYLFYVTFQVFHTPEEFLLCMVVLGAALIALGVVLSKHQAEIENFIWNHIPAIVARHLPVNRR